MGIYPVTVSGFYFINHKYKYYVNLFTTANRYGNILYAKLNKTTKYPLNCEVIGRYNMKTKRIFLIFLALIMLISVLAACNTVAPEQSKQPAETDGEAFDLSVSIGSEPQTIDPALNCAADSAVMLNHFFEGLMKWADDGSGNAILAQGQAQSYEKTENEDGTVTYTFKIRDDAKWSDGQPVTADDFVYSWQRLVDPATAADYSYLLASVKGFDEILSGQADPDTLGVAAPDENTFEVTLTTDAEYFTEICALPCTFPVRKDIVEANGDQWTFDTATYISNGPYKLSEWVHNSYIKAVRSDTYYDADNIGPDSITFQLMDDNNAMLAAYESGTIQFVDEIPVDEAESLLATGDLNVVPQFGTYFVCFNCQKAPFDDARVREAFSLVIDRSYIVEKITQTGETPATGLVCPGISDAQGVSGEDFRTVGGDYYSAAAEDYEANCEKARELLAEAGYPNGEGFPTVEYLYNTGDRHKAIGEALQNMWQTQLGVTVTLNNQEAGVFLETCKNGDYTIARNAWLPDYNDAMSFLDMWLTDGGNNVIHYSSADYDDAIENAMAAADLTERMEYMHDAEDIIIGRDAALAPVYFYTCRYLLDDSVEGMFYNPLGFYFFMNCTKTSE